MYRFSGVLVVLSFLVGQFAWSETRETMTYQDVIKDLDKDTLLVSDIDNTLLEPLTPVGSDQWFYYLYGLFGKKPAEDVALDHNLVHLWNNVQQYIQVKAVEKRTPQWLKAAQARGIKMMALTARTGALAPVTVKQLQSQGIRFDRSAPFSKDLTISRTEFNTEDDAFFTGGVLSVGESNSKGPVFFKFLEKIGFRPKRIVFVDDKKKHVLSMEAAHSQSDWTRGSFYRGYRYGATDKRVQEFTAGVADAVGVSAKN